MVRRFNRTQTERNEKKISAQSYSHTVRQSAKMNEYSKVGYPLQSPPLQKTQSLSVHRYISWMGNHPSQRQALSQREP